jgi:hypothetical protein
MSQSELHIQTPMCTRFFFVGIALPCNETIPTMAATNKLIDHKVKAIQPAEKVVKHSDGGGLYLHVTLAGAKLWRLAYRLECKQ